VVHMNSSHDDESLQGHGDTAEQRRFGALFAVIAAAAAAYFHFNKAPSPYLAASLGALALVLLLLTMARPGALQGPRRAWIALGTVLGRIVSPLVLGVIYFVMITPLAIGGRLTGRDELRLKRQRQSATYWIDREAPGPTAESFGQQF